VTLVVEQGPTVISYLESLGIRFSRKEGGGSLALGREGGHSRRRIVHAGDSTGRTIEQGLLDAVSAESNIRVIENRFAVDLIRRVRLFPNDPDAVLGAYVLDTTTREIRPFAARIVMLATGGCGKVYRYTSNPDVMTGSRWPQKRGARANLFDHAFHPTCLHPGENFLKDRAEGDLTSIGDRFLEGHPMQELALRDAVARRLTRR
jgi:L-aspartate oxidase